MKFVLIAVVTLIAGVSSQSYPHFEFRGDVLENNSYIFHGLIGEGIVETSGNVLSIITH